uniref:Uncharacterized protein n=1 Tax=Rhabditophanes sp. KR3021 TaxID=114890 RepID=A0AC35TLD8_9BILA
MKITRLCMLILIVIVKTIHTTEVFINFLLENSELCGDPWQMQTLPVIGLCTAGCREGLDVCMEDENLRQRCKRLPLPCVKLYSCHDLSMKPERSDYI